jgi:glutamate dehydrogenase/leucine dehydrogenase
MSPFESRAARVHGSNIATTREQAMRKREAAEVKADVEARIAQIEQMSLDQIGVFQCRILTEIANGGIEPREASALDRALRKRLKAIEQDLEAGRIKL